MAEVVLTKYSKQKEETKWIQKWDRINLWLKDSSRAIAVQILNKIQ